MKTYVYSMTRKRALLATFLPLPNKGKQPTSKNEGRDEHTMEQPQSRILLGNKKEQTIDIDDNVEGHQNIMQRESDLTQRAQCMRLRTRSSRTGNPKLWGE